jgi:chitin synthase
MIAAVYGLQAVIFIIKRQWQHVGWMIIYIIAFPIYSFVLPVYSFWAQDDFSWGNTRIVVGESGNKKIVATEDEGFDPDSIPLQTWDEYATLNKLPGRRGGAPEKFVSEMGGYDNVYEMDDIHSMYSSVKPASTILTGLPNMGGHPYMPPHSPALPNMNRQSAYSAYTGISHVGHDHGQQQRLMSMGGRSTADYWQDGQHNRGGPMSHAGLPSTDNLLGGHTPPPRGLSATPLGFASRPASQMDFTRAGGGPDDESIIDAIRSVLREVDLETITKKQGIFTLWFEFFSRNMLTCTA